MWKFISEIILKHRLFIVLIIMILTVFMFQKAKQVKLSYMMPKLLPENHKAMLDYEDFINSFVGTPNQQCSVMYAAALQKVYNLPFDGEIEGRLNSIVDRFELFAEKGLDNMLLQLEISHYMNKHKKLLEKVMSMSI